MKLRNTCIILFALSTMITAQGARRQQSDMMRLAAECLNIKMDNTSSSINNSCNTIYKSENAYSNDRVTCSGPLMIATSTDICPDIKACDGLECFRIFSNGGKGFAIISSDDRCQPILGYSATSTFDVSNMPSNVRTLLRSYAKMIRDVTNGITMKCKSMSSLPIITTAKKMNTISYEAADSIPQLVSTSWAQDKPYNWLCPNDTNGVRCVVGCVATAMAQVMNYHKWPLHGIGSHTYYCDSIGQALSADFSQATYNWNTGLIDNWHGYTTEQGNDVALISYHCGIAVDMSYGLKAGSGADMAKCTNALVNFFGYDKNARFYRHDLYSNAEWREMVNEEMRQRRPILYCGSDTATHLSHAYILDGYDGKRLYHFNFGWSGSYNGFYSLEIQNLKKYDSASDTMKDVVLFDSYHTMVTGIQQPNTESTYQSQLIVLDSMSYQATGSEQNICAHISNIGRSLFVNGKIATLLYKDGILTAVDYVDEDTIDYEYTVDPITDVMNFKDSVYYSFSDFDKLKEMPNGEYTLFFGSRGEKEKDWQVIRSTPDTRNHYTIVIKDGIVSVMEPPSLSVSTKIEFETIRKDKTSTKTVVKNGKLYIITGDGQCYDVSGRKNDPNEHKN